MKHESHPSNNLVVAPPLPPGGVAAGLVSAPVPCTRTAIAGLPALVTFWRPTAAEILQLAEGGLVQLWVYGTEHPPVGIGVEAPHHCAYGPRAH